MPVTRNNDKNEIHMTDLGVTMRTLLAVGAKGYEETQRRTWKIVYKNVIIGEVRVATNHVKGKKDATSKLDAGSTC